MLKGYPMTFEWPSVGAGLLAVCLASVSSCGPRVVTDSASPPAGTEGAECRADGGCDVELTCLSGRCVRLPTPGNSSGGADSGTAGTDNDGGEGGQAGGPANVSDAGASGSADGGDAGSSNASSGGWSGGTGGWSGGTGGWSGGTGGIGSSGSSSGGAGGCIATLAAQVQFITPYVSLPNRTSTLIVRGTGFKAAQSVTVNIGGTRVGPLAPDSDTQITVQVPPVPAGRYPVSIEGGSCTGTDAELLVQPVPVLQYRAISAPSKREKLIWDSERQTLYAVNRTDQEIERYRYAEPSWSTLAPYVVPALTDIALAPNGRSLIISTRGAILEAQLEQATFMAVQRAVNPDTSCGGYFNQLTMANDGKVFVVFDLAQCSGFTNSYLYDMRDHSLLKNSGGFLYNGLAGGSLDGSRIYAGSNGVSPPQAIKIFNSLAHEIVDASPSYNLGAISVSSNASRVILQNVDVYSRALSLTGHLPPNALALASLDSSRAFVLGETGAESRLIVRDLNGALGAGAVYPVLKAIDLADPPSSASGSPGSLTMSSLRDDSAVFVSGDRNILVVPVTDPVGGTGSGACANPIDIASNAIDYMLGTTDGACVRTKATFNAVVCGNWDGRTLKVNGVTAQCTATKSTFAPAIDGYNYFEIGAGLYSFATIAWFTS